MIQKDKRTCPACLCSEICPATICNCQVHMVLLLLVVLKLSLSLSLNVKCRKRGIGLSYHETQLFYAYVQRLTNLMARVKIQFLVADAFSLSYFLWQKRQMAWHCKLQLSAKPLGEHFMIFSGCHYISSQCSERWHENEEKVNILLDRVKMTQPMAAHKLLISHELLASYIQIDHFLAIAYSRTCT